MMGKTAGSLDIVVGTGVAGHVADLSAAESGRPVANDGLPGAVPIVSPPYYDYPARPGPTSTLAGLTVDGSMRVLDGYGTLLDGLGAPGEVVGGFHGAGYYRGTGLGNAALFGRIAGAAVGRE